MLLRVDLSTTPPGYKLLEIREFYLTFCLQTFSFGDGLQFPA